MYENGDIPIAGQSKEHTMQYTDPETPAVSTRHFGLILAGRMLRRHKTKKIVQFTNGNLMVELEVPPKLLLPYKEVQRRQRLGTHR